MKKLNLVILLLLFATTISFAQRRAQGDKVEITEVGVTRVGGDIFGGGEVWVNFRALVDERFGRNATMTFTPILYDTVVEMVLPQLKILSNRSEILRQRRGEVWGNEVRVGRPGEQVGYMVRIKYKDWMNGSALRIKQETRYCNEYFELENPIIIHDIRLAEDHFDPCYAFIKPKKVNRKCKVQSGTMYLEFKVSSDEIIMGFRNNTAEVAKLNRVIDSINADKESKTISSIELWGTCSPEGSYSYNAQLAERRTESVCEYIVSKYMIPRDLFKLSSTPEDWQGLKEAVKNSDLKNKWMILDIIDSKASYAQKDADMRKLSNYPELLDYYYPPLRRVNYSVHYDIKNYNDKQLKAIYGKNPENLSNEELYRLSCQKGVNCNKVRQYAAKCYPDSPSANLNMANIELKKGNIEAAENYLKKASSQLEITAKTSTPKQVAVYYNTSAILQMQKGDMQSAKLLFAKAAQMGLPEAQQNLDVMEGKAPQKDCCKTPQKKSKGRTHKR